MSRVTTLVLALSAAANLSAQAPDATTTRSPAQVQAPAFPDPKPLPDSTYAVIRKRFPVIYSPAAEQKKLHGTVVLSVLFNEAGVEESAEAVSGDPVLTLCAIASIGKWEIQPYLRAGQPVKVKVPLSYEFIYEDPIINLSAGAAPPQETGPVANYVILSGRFAKLKLRDKHATPSYPQQAKNAHIQGTVVFAASIGKDGAIRELKLVSGNPMLAKAAWESIRQWHYKPYIYHGNPVAYDIQIETNFELRG